MITINKCNISPDGKCLRIKAHINPMSFYEDCYITSVLVVKDEDYSDVGISDKAKVLYNNTDKTVKSIELNVSAKDLDLDTLNNNILFIYIQTSGIPKITTPCTMDEDTSICVAMNMRPIYNSAMSYIKELERTCETPKGFIDMIFRIKALELSLKTGHYKKAIDYWKMFNNRDAVITSKRCGCNGFD